jgi:ubiquinone/menaquinone biosynthesis C-methylase UbiE
MFSSFVEEKSNYENINSVIQRAELNDKGSLYNLEKWIIENAKPFNGMDILDIGCGSGKQIFAFANIPYKINSILGIDISDKGVSDINSRVMADKHFHIKAINVDMDKCIDLIQSKKFDLIISSYAIYYSKDMVYLLKNIRQLLKNKGQIFVCGPGDGTNIEMNVIIDKVGKPIGIKSSPITDFIDDLSIKEVSNNFNLFKKTRLFNKIYFYSTDDVLLWWKNHISYNQLIFDDITEIIMDHFRKNKYFEISKNVLGIQYYI